MAKRKSPKQRKKEREQQRQRGQQMYIIGGVVVVAILGAIIFALTSLPTEAPIPADVSERYADFMTSTTDEGYPLLGNPEAPVQVREFSSFSCAGCLSFHQSVFPQLLDNIERGEINFVYVPLQTGSVPNQAGAARTAICAGEQGMFWEMHDVLFSWHETYVNTAYQDGRIRTGVQELGLNTSEFNRCFNSSSTDTVLAAAIQEGVQSTPTIQVNGATVAADLTSIEDAIRSNLPASGDFEPGVIDTEQTEENAMDEPVGEEDTTEEEPVDEESTDEESVEEDVTDEDATEEEPVDEESTDEEPVEEDATDEEEIEDSAAEATEDASE